MLFFSFSPGAPQIETTSIQMAASLPTKEVYLCAFFTLPLFELDTPEPEEDASATMWARLIFI